MFVSILDVAIIIIINVGENIKTVYKHVFTAKYNIISLLHLCYLFREQYDELSLSLGDIIF